MKENKGFTLIECIIVVAIMAILSGASYMGIRSLFHLEVKECMSEITNSLGKVRLESMSKGDRYYYLVIEKEDTGLYRSMIQSTERLRLADYKEKGTIIGTRKKIASNKIIIGYSMSSDGSHEIELSETTPLLINFVSSSGAFDSDYKLIHVKSNTKILKLNMVKKTGNYYINES